MKPNTSGSDKIWLIEPAGYLGASPNFKTDSPRCPNREGSYQYDFDKHCFSPNRTVLIALAI